MQLASSKEQINKWTYPTNYFEDLSESFQIKFFSKKQIWGRKRVLLLRYAN